jgi:signal transduction histidine kinase
MVEVIDRAFEAFFTTTEVGRGTGPGLDTARRIGVERHGGSIGITSTPGATMVTALLPLG